MYSTVVFTGSRDEGVRDLYPPVRVLVIWKLTSVRNECTTGACVKAAARILERMDPSVDPCEDFYQFSCGQFVKKNVVPDDMFHKSTLQAMQEEVNVLIKSKS